VYSESLLRRDPQERFPSSFHSVQKRRAQNLQIREVVLDLLRRELPEAGADGTLDALDAEEVVCGGTDDA